MQKSTKAFSLIEIIISISILTIWVFWVYKLIWNNMNLLSNNENFITLNSLYNPFKECLNSIWYNSLSTKYNSWDTFSVNFWENNLWCATWSYNENLNFSWVSLNNQNYFLYAKVIWKDINKINLETNIFNDTSGYLFNSWSENENMKYIEILK